MNFLREHGTRIWTAAILLGLAAVMAHTLVTLSSEVTRWDRYEVVVLSREVPPNSKDPTLQYVAVAPDGRKIRLSTNTLLNVGDHVLIEETIRRNGHSSFNIVHGAN